MIRLCRTSTLPKVKMRFRADFFVELSEEIAGEPIDSLINQVQAVFPAFILKGLHMPSTLDKYLKQFNRKERFHLLSDILGFRGNPSSREQGFPVSSGFINKLESYLSQITDCIEFRQQIYSAMDYHLDWIYASIFLTNIQSSCTQINSHGYTRGVGQVCITGNQQDVDFLLLFKDRNPEKKRLHMIMLEAKVDTGWSNDQLDSKANRLEAIFGHDGRLYEDIVVPYFITVSPTKPTASLRIEYKKLREGRHYPGFMHKDGSINWIQLDTPETLYKITRCTKSSEDLKPNKNGDLWKQTKVKLGPRT